MPANVVKTPADEKKWERAKHEAQKGGYTGERKWKVTQSIFQNMKHPGKKQASAAEIDAFVKAAMDRYAKLGIPKEAAEAMFKAEVNKLAEQLGVIEPVVTPADQAVKIAEEALVQTGMTRPDAQKAIYNHLMDKIAADKKAQVKTALATLVKAAKDSKK